MVDAGVADGEGEGESMMKILLDRNGPCYCGSGRKYKKCCLIKKVLTKSELSKMTFNKKFNRYESSIDHHYVPFHYSSFKYLGVTPFKAKLKCRLLHKEGGSIIIPEFVLLESGWIQPLNFTVPILAKFDENNITCDIKIDIQGGETIMVRFNNKGYLKTFSDKSQLFECELFGPSDINEYTCGEFSLIDSELYIKLFHHTNDSGHNGIITSNSLRSSRWNYRGNKECVNFHFIYFTHIPHIKYDSDLIPMAMSKEGNLNYMIDSFVQPTIIDSNYRNTYKDSIYTAKVYRSTTKDRNNPLSFFVPIETIDIKHVYMHNQDGSIFYETCFPYIHRIKTLCNGSLIFDDKSIIRASNDIVYSDYSIIGDATVVEGLAAPFEEEETKFIFKFEDCGITPILEFWFNNSNSDLFSDKKIITMEMKDVKSNPTK